MVDGAERDKRAADRSKSYGLQLILLAAIGAAITYVVWGLHPPLIVALADISLLVVGLASYLTPGAKWVQQNLGASSAFVDLPGDRLVLWAVPVRLRRYYLTGEKPYRKRALIGAAISALVMVAMATGRGAAGIPWYAHGIAPSAILALALFSAWVHPFAVVGVSMQDDMLRIRDHSLSIVGLSERSLAVPYGSIRFVTAQPLAEGQDGPWLMHLALADGRVLELGLEGAANFTRVREVFDRKQVQVQSKEAKSSHDPRQLLSPPA